MICDVMCCGFLAFGVRTSWDAALGVPEALVKGDIGRCLICGVLLAKAGQSF